MAKPRDVTEDCPDCGGGGTIQDYYTLPPRVCDTCGGSGVVPKGEADRMRKAAQQQEQQEPEVTADAAEDE